MSIHGRGKQRRCTSWIAELRICSGIEKSLYHGGVAVESSHHQGGSSELAGGTRDAGGLTGFVVLLCVTIRNLCRLSGPDPSRQRIWIGAAAKQQLYDFGVTAYGSQQQSRHPGVVMDVHIGARLEQRLDRFLVAARSSDQ